MDDTDRDQLLALARERGVVSATDVAQAGIHSQYLTRLVGEGVLDRIARGTYRLSERPITEHHSLAVAAAAVPNGVICLLTALRFHELTTQLPAEVWIALPSKAWRPRVVYPRLRIVRFSGLALSEGVESHTTEGVAVRVYSAAKTVADCFKYRNKVGIDVAVEALRDFTRLHRNGATELAGFARICRVTRVMQPYLDAVS